MRRLFRACALGVALVLPATAVGQSSSSEQSTRPATTTVSGTTGIWFVPSSAVLPARKLSASLYRTNIDDGQGFADMSTFPATVAVGIANRAEITAAWTIVTRLDRDTRPLFFDPTTGTDSGAGGGILVNYPKFANGWTGNKRGDLWLGGKVNVGPASSSLGAAIRAMVKVPVGDDNAGTSSGKTDFEVDGIVSSFGPVIDLTGYAGVLVRGNPAGYTLTNGLTWGVAAAFPQSYNLGLKISAEVFGEHYFNNTISAPAGLTGSDGSPVPTSTRIKSPAVASVGLTWQAPNGFFIGGAASWNLGMKNRDAVGFPDTPKDDKGLQVRLGFHPGALGPAVPGRSRGTVSPPAGPNPPGGPGGPGGPGSAGPGAAGPGAAGPGAGGPGAGGPGAGGAPPAAAAAANRPPTVRASCDPCTVEVGRSATISADAQDPDGDPLTYQWTAGAGTIASPTSRQSNWTAPMQVGPVPFTVTVNDGRGGTATDRVTIQVTQPTQQTYNFEDVHFEFDRFTLRQDALGLLDSAVTAMQANQNLRLTVEGHTCNIGTAEYNLALGDRRARAVRDYLVSRGIAANRLTTVSYGEERPKYDNSREETRRLNRRAALVVRLE